MGTKDGCLIFPDLGANAGNDGVQLLRRSGTSRIEPLDFRREGSDLQFMWLPAGEDFIYAIGTGDGHARRNRYPFPHSHYCSKKRRKTTKAMGTSTWRFLLLLSTKG